MSKARALYTVLAIAALVAGACCGCLLLFGNAIHRAWTGSGVSFGIVHVGGLLLPLVTLALVLGLRRQDAGRERRTRWTRALLVTGVAELVANALLLVVV